jgi:3-oxoacyl-[acyl-carrier protein] reductase
MTLGRLDLSGMVALVTGGSRGIGAACCELLAERGADVAVGCLHAEHAGAEVVTRVRAAGRRATLVAGDVASTRDVSRLVDDTVSALGGLDILVNNAGVLHRGDLSDESSDQRARVIGVNLEGVFNCVEAALPHLRRRPGAIVNVSSIAGKIGDLTAAPSYGASKGGVNALTKSLARQLGPAGIRVNAVAPHAIATDMSAAWSPERRRDIVATIPLGRVGEPVDVAEAVAFLAAPAAAFITGEIMDVNGGSWMD